MIDFADFRDTARAAFASLHISACLYEKDSARGGFTTRYRLQATGPGLHGRTLKAEADTQTGAIAELRRQVAAARQQVREQPTGQSPQGHAADWEAQRVSLAHVTKGT